MTGLPSQLGYQIINDVCKKPVKLEGCCCAGAVLAIWSMKLPVSVLAHISNMPFTKESHKQVFEAADKVHQSSQQLQVAAVSVNLDETQAAFDPQNQPQVAAFTRKPNRGGQSGSGGGANQSNRGNGRGGGRGKRGGRGGSGAQASRGPRHSSNPPEACCDRHYRHGADSWYCVAPLTCPWKDKCSART